ncbi:agamous-like MADS-box AGL62 [Olea europaea subsp. europaea]|uniref:Agamous-like MADS-box AGL62 n=1 Tax=Olea europaea subsp. europaea TaxID=158383 RepID=A0A8S0Q6J7_OLEEU|nr:agamous-like MADS-box AGL62 [Olea europaea subsp. europaea]
MTASNGIPEKKTKGKRKIEIQKIDKKTSLQVSFSKRRKGLFKKAAETRILCGTDVAILIQSPGNKFFTFGEPSVESILNRCQFLDDAHNPVVEGRGKSEREFWWENENVEKMEFPELGAFEEILTGLRDKISNRVSHNPVVDEMGKSEREFWWENEILGKMELRELGAFEEILTGLRDEVLNRASVSSKFNSPARILMMPDCKKISKTKFLAVSRRDMLQFTHAEQKFEPKTEETGQKVQLMIAMGEICLR